MKSFFKTLGKGILYFFTPIVWAIGISLGSVIGLLVFVGYLVVAIFLFFTGRNLFKELPEDEEVRLLKEGKKAPVAEAVLSSLKEDETLHEEHENHYPIRDESEEDIEENEEDSSSSFELERDNLNEEENNFEDEKFEDEDNNKEEEKEDYTNEFDV